MLFFPSSEFRNSDKLYSSQRVHSCLLLSRPIRSFWMLFIWISILTLNEPEMSLLLNGKTNWSYSLAGAIMHVLQELKSVQLPSLALHLSLSLSLTWTVYSCYWLYINTCMGHNPSKGFYVLFVLFFKTSPMQLICCSLTNYHSLYILRVVWNNFRGFWVETFSY